MNTRRHCRRTLAVLLLGSIIGMLYTASAQTPELHPAKVKVLPKIGLRAQPFSLKAVRLLDGPFKSAMERNGTYLLALEADRLLCWFRKNAGLEPKAPVYGGWETQGVAGHTLGHYLTACAQMYAASGDARYKQRVDYIVEELTACQQRRGDGYVGAIPDGDRVFREISEGDIRSQGFDLNGLWVPWYTLHKLFAGLIDSYLYADNPQALTVAVKLADWTIRITQKLTPEQWQRMLACEHGGMNESMTLLYAITGRQDYLEMARKFHHRAVLDPLERQEERLAGLHGNTQVPKVIGCARQYEMTGEERYRTIAAFFWNAVTGHHLYAIGGFTSGEHFGPPNRLSDRLTTTTAETCKTYNLLKLTRHLFCWNPSAEYADYYERALYNHILASQNPDDGMVCYYMPLQPGAFKTYSTPHDSFWCCVGTGIENHTRYADSIYFRDDQGLYVNLFIPSELRWQEKGLTLRQETRFPEENATRLTLACEKPVPLTLRIRYPAWAAGPLRVKINGRTQKADGQPGSYLQLQRAWKNGDRIEITLPMSLRQEAMPDNPNRVALLYGPIVLAGALGAQDREAPRIPAFVTNGRPLDQWLKPVPGKTLTYRTQGVGRPADVTLIPYYAMHHQRYSVYWDLFTEAQWQRREAEYRAEQERLRELERRTVDALAIGEMQPERDHNLQGEKTGAGDFQGRKWRHAVDGGWFSFEMKVLPDQPMDLVLTYWGSDVGAREFDILVDGEKIATQVLNNNLPDRFFDVTHPLPESLTRGKQRVTVRLQAHPGRMAGGLFGCRVVRR